MGKTDIFDHRSIILRRQPNRHGLPSDVGFSLAVFLLALLALCLATTPSTAQSTREIARANAADATSEAALSAATLRLFQAVEVNDLPGVKAAIEAGASLEAKNAVGKTPADVAVEKGHFIIAHFLLSERGKARVVKRPKRRPPKVAGKPKPLAVPAKSKTDFTAGMAKGGKFGYPPRRPTDPMFGKALPEAVEIDKTPGFRAGRATPMPDPFKQPEPMMKKTVPEIPVAEPPIVEKAMAENLAVEPESAPSSDPEKIAEGEKSANAISRLFQSLVDIVTPSKTKPVQPNMLEQAVEPSTDVLAEAETIAPEAAQEVVPPKAADEGKSANTVSRFFQSLVDTVTPSEPGPAQPDAPERMAEPAADTLAETETADPKPETDTMTAEPVMDKAAHAPKVIRKVAPAQPVAKPTAKRHTKLAAQPSTTTASRALNRLKGLVGDAPEEDAFGLPKIAAPTPAPRRDAGAVQAPDLAEDNILIPTDSDDVTGTLERLRTALSRDITTNPLEILKASRRAGAERMIQLQDQIKTVPTDLTAKRTRAPSLTQPAPAQLPKHEPVNKFIDELADIRREPPKAPVPEKAMEDAAVDIRRETPLAPLPEKPMKTTMAVAQPETPPARAPETPMDAATVSPPEMQPMPGPEAMETMPSSEPLTEALPEIQQTEAPLDPALENLNDLLKDDSPPAESIEPVQTVEPVKSKRPPLNFSDRVTDIKRRAYAEEEMLRKAAEDAAKEATDVEVKDVLSEKQKKTETVDALARYFKEEPNAKNRKSGILVEGYRSAPDIGAVSEQPASAVAPKAMATVGEAPPGQTTGKLNPGFLDKLARLFSNEETTDAGWSAQVQVDDPTPPMGSADSNAAGSLQNSEAAPTGWKTSVELNAGNGNSILLGVTETPVDRIEPAQPPAEMAQAQPAAVAEPPKPLEPETLEPELPQLNETPAPIAEPSAPVETLAQVEELPVVAEPLIEPKSQPEPLAEGSILEQIEARLRKREGLPPLDRIAPSEPRDRGAPAPAADNLDGDLNQLDQLTPTTDSLDAQLGTLDEPTSQLDDSLDAAFGEPAAPGEPTDDSLNAAFGEPPDEPAAAPQDKPGSAKRARRSAPPTLPYSDPLRPPTAAAAKSTPPPAGPQITRAMPLRQVSPAEEAARRAMRLERQEALATGYPTPGQVAAKQQASASPMWPVTKLAKNDTPTRPARAARPAMLSRTTLTGVQMSLGESVTLENTLPPEGGIDPNNECVKKNRGTTLFCIEPIDWPASISDKFQVPTILYTGPMAIVRFDQGTASRLHALFPSEDFETVSAFYQTRYGTPTELWKRSIAPLAEPRRDNPTIAWRSRDPKTNVVSILELRKYDDTRGGFPDTNRGAVMLYTANSPPIFPQVSSHELMRIGRLKQAEGG